MANNNFSNYLFLILVATAVPKTLTNLNGMNSDFITNLTSYVDFAINPCDYFYIYACGNWLSAHKMASPIPLSVTNHKENVFNKELENILDDKSKKIRGPFAAVFSKLLTFYESCRHQNSTYEVQHYMDLISQMENISWPEADRSWMPGTDFNMWSLMGRLAGIGFEDLLFSIAITRHSAIDYQLELDKFKDNSYERMEAYNRSQSSNETLQKIGDKMNDFITKLNRLYNNNKKSQAVHMTLGDLQNQIPNLDFIAYFSSLNVDEVNWSQVPVLVKNLPYFQQLEELLKVTSSETLMHVLKMSLEGYFDSIKLQTCIYSMRQVATLALDYLIELESYKSERQANDAVIQKIFQNLKQKFLEILQQHSKEFSFVEMYFLKNKIKRMRLNIGNLPQEVDSSFYTQYFNNWQVRNESFYWNHIMALKHKKNTEYKFLKTGPSGTSQSYDDGLMGSAAFSYDKNLVILPYSYLRLPTFHKDLHQLLLYASLGNTLGHEILHAFDITGLKYDADGIPSSLMANISTTNSHIANSLQCLRNISRAFLDERLADFNGFRLAYDSYFQREETQQFKAFTNFTNKQLFYLQFAQSYCASEAATTSIESHDLAATRVRRTVANSREFRAAFLCPPENEEFKTVKCNMW